MDLCLDLADCAEHIYTTGQVVWSNASGRAGVRFSELSSESLSRLREWLFVNVMAGVANGEAEVARSTFGARRVLRVPTTPTRWLPSPPCSGRWRRLVPTSLLPLQLDCGTRSDFGSRLRRCHCSRGLRIQIS